VPIINIFDTKYPIVSFVGGKLLGWQIRKSDDENWDVWWTDAAVSTEKLACMKPF
jgi:hypothetical protein